MEISLVGSEVGLAKQEFIRGSRRLAFQFQFQFQLFQSRLPWTKKFSLWNEKKQL